MSLAYPKARNTAEGFYWSGVAISLAQTLGLHRNELIAQQRGLEESQEPLWKRIWWCCVLRDRWLSYEMERPMRINADDCNIPIPSTVELYSEVRQIPSEVRAKYLTPDCYSIFSDWLILLELTTTMGEVLSWSAKSSERKPTIEKIEEEIVRYSDTLRRWGQNVEDTAACHIEQLQLFVEYDLVLLKSFERFPC